MSPELNEEGRAIYMSLVRQNQWLISLGQFDIACTIMTMSRFLAALREGHMKRMKRIYGYVKQRQNGCIRVRVDLPNYTDLQQVKYDWTSIYGIFRKNCRRICPCHVENRSSLPHMRMPTYITTILPVGQLLVFYIW